MVRRNSENVFGSYFLFIFLSLLLLLGNLIGVTLFLRYPLEVVLIPPRKLLHSLESTLIENAQFLFAPGLKKKIVQSDDYKRELDVLKQKIQLLEEENNSLRTQLETPLPPAWDFIPASVLGYERYLIIDKGLRDGVSKDMVVINQNIVVGKVVAVSQKTSQVQLLWDPDSKISAKTDKNVRGLITGVFGNEISLTKVLQKEPLNTFDVVLTSGEEEVFPPNLLIGKVEEVIAKQEEVYKQAKITPLIDYNKLQQVFIVSGY